MILHIPAYFPYLQDSHQISCKIQALIFATLIKASQLNRRRVIPYTCFLNGICLFPARPDSFG